MKRQFDCPGPHDTEARISAQMGRSPKYFVSSPREMTTNMVQPAPDAGTGIAFEAVARALRLKTGADFDMLE